jgi:hypothetical protein
MAIPMRRFLLFVVVGLTGISVGQSIAPALAITITGPTIVKVGSRAKIDIVVTNQSNRTILYGSDSPGHGERNFIFDVRDSFGKPATKTQYFKAVTGEDQGPGPQIMILGKLVEFSLKPGGTVKDTANLSELFDLKPGKYTVQLSRNAGFNTVVVDNPSEERRRAQQDSVTAISNAVVFSVVP